MKRMGADTLTHPIPGIVTLPFRRSDGWAGH